MSTVEASCDSESENIMWARGSAAGETTITETSMPPTRDRLKAVAAVLKNPAWVCFVWFGLTAAVTLLVVPAIFTAGSVTRPVALDVARSIFLALSKAEFVLLILLLILVRVSMRARQLWAYCGILALIMIAHAAWLIPELSARTDSILAGVEPAPSVAHAAYSITSLVKLLLLLAVGVLSSADSAAAGKMPAE